MGVPWGLPELERHYSPNWYAVYRAAGIPNARWPDADRIWRAHYAKHRPKLMSGARRVLGQLARRHKLGLVTSGDRNRVMGQLRKFGLLRVLRTRVCGGDLEEKKPHPAPLQMALRQMALEPAECVYVGDTPEDVEMARAAGVRPIAVLGPFPTEKRLRAVRPNSCWTICGNCRDCCANCTAMRGVRVLAPDIMSLQKLLQGLGGCGARAEGAVG